jgi:hypothetical protein
MRLDCFIPDDVHLDIRPASSRRDWMDATGDHFAYRCLPLSIANAHGWVICCGGSFEAEWNGGNDPGDVVVQPAGDGDVEARGHFGYGILTIAPLAVFRTDQGSNLWVSGPPNMFKDGIQPLSAVVESDWIPYHFTMNWRFTRPHNRVRFEKGEPYCFLFPVPRGAVEGVQPRIRRMGEEPEIERQVEYANKFRSFLGKVKSLTGAGAISNEKQLKFQKWYMQGMMPDGSRRIEWHQKHLDVRPFDDVRTTDRRETP